MNDCEEFASVAGHLIFLVLEATQVGQFTRMKS